MPKKKLPKPKVNVEIIGPLMGDDFIPHKQLVVTFQPEDIQDYKLWEGKDAVKKLILEAIEKKLDKL